jgi:hypothetical protein
MEYSLPAWLGALAGTVVAVVIYVPAIRAVERSFRAPAFLAVDIAILATVGYWIGNAIGGSRF